MKNKNIISPLFICSLLSLSIFTSSAYAELKLPSGADRRPNLSVDPFERAREAMRKLPSSEPEEEIPEIEATPEQAQPAGTFEEQEHGLAPTIVSTENGASGDAFSYELAITVDALSINAGGITNAVDNDDEEPTKTGVLGVVDLVGEYDTGAAGLWDDGLFFVYAAMIFGKGPSVGDLHGTSGIDGGEGSSAFRIVEAWYEHSFPYSHSSALIGLHDFNGEFYVSEFASLFLNAGFGMGQVIAENGGPSGYPIPTLGARIKAEVTEKIYFQTALYTAAPSDDAYNKVFEAKLPSNDEVFLATEFGMINKEPGESGYYKAGIGLWYLRADQQGFEDLNGTTVYTEAEAKPGNTGVYVLAEMSIGEKLGIFFKHGRGKKEFNQFSQFYAAGLNYTGLIPGREEDVLGLGLVHTRQSSAYLDATDNSTFVAETAFEITYTTNLTDWLSVQPDFQYIQQPSMSTEIGNTMVMGVRVSAAF